MNYHEFDKFNFHGSSFYRDIVNECGQTSMDYVMTKENISLEEQIDSLRNQVHELNFALNRCIDILNQFQHTSSDYIHYIDDKTDIISQELTKHTDSFHAMLIIGNNKEEKNESNIS